MKLNVHDHRRHARRRLPRFVFDYVDGGAEDEACLRRNVDDLNAVRLLPTCLRDTSHADPGIEVFGQHWAMPAGVAPIGFSGLVRPEGDLLLARAAAAAGVPFVLSTASNARLEAVRDAGLERNPAAVQWMQLYVMTDRSIAEQLVRRARHAGYGALVLTVDVAVSGLRERDVRNGFRLPFRFTPSMLLDLALHPAWSLDMARRGRSPAFVNLAEHEEAGASAQLQAALLARAMDRTLVWDQLDWLRRLWDGPLILKGLLHPDDARRAVRHGVDGIVVSNHGGRQLDAAPSTISVLPRIVDAVKGALPVFVDSGFRRGSDVVKALAAGATAAFVGRAAVWGMAAGGEAGARAVLQTLCDETQRTMALIGADTVADIAPHHLTASLQPGDSHG
ncbi:alpha-hydroxy-acid oxidizing protein [Variovorax sp. ZS18.2.2]|uniref:alpha-hydroxy acid oxidase n=1 Tax=Variovorax sp. ZS18.2.2 TaxID=2971255 RepID=UPI002150C1D3|nr:alpha-hydroxy acid oxidase [Variovorax sp. ZS18.2.2]MCR6477168.1 alpha-hydroxy-acid oxidizing protein [Variovorax sp. ZS18.2.2]